MGAELSKGYCQSLEFEVFEVKPVLDCMCLNLTARLILSFNNQKAAAGASGRETQEKKPVSLKTTFLLEGKTERNNFECSVSLQIKRFQFPRGHHRLPNQHLRAVGLPEQESKK